MGQEPDQPSARTTTGNFEIVDTQGNALLPDHSSTSARIRSPGADAAGAQPDPARARHDRLLRPHPGRSAAVQDRRLRLRQPPADAEHPAAVRRERWHDLARPLRAGARAGCVAPCARSLAGAGAPLWCGAALRRWPRQRLRRRRSPSAAAGRHDRSTPPPSWRSRPRALRRPGLRSRTSTRRAARRPIWSPRRPTARSARPADRGREPDPGARLRRLGARAADRRQARRPGLLQQRARLSRHGRRRARRPQTLVGGLAGATLGSSSSSADGRLLAAVATERGVWVAAVEPRVASAAAPPDRSGQVAAGAGRRRGSAARARSSPGPRPAAAGAADPRASISPPARRRRPAPPTTLSSVPPGTRSTSSRSSAGARAPTAAWIESWFDCGGSTTRRSGPPTSAAAASPVAVLAVRAASGLALAADAAGDQAVALRSLHDRRQPARAHAALRRRAALRLASRARPDRLHPGARPSRSGRAAVVVGWVEGGPVLAAAAGPGGAVRRSRDRSLRQPVRLDLAVGLRAAARGARGLDAGDRSTRA